MTLNIGPELATLIDDAGEIIILADSTELTVVWIISDNDEGEIRGGATTIKGVSTDTACISIGDSIYRQSDEPPIEYKVRDREQDDLRFLETLMLERQD